MQKNRNGVMQLVGMLHQVLRLTASAFALCLLLTSVSGCAFLKDLIGDEANNEGDPFADGGHFEGPRQTFHIDQHGGEFHLGAGAMLTIPEGALTLPTELTVVELSPPAQEGFAEVGAFFRFEPEGFTFSTAVTISLPVPGSFGPDYQPQGPSGGNGGNFDGGHTFDDNNGFDNGGNNNDDHQDPNNGSGNNNDNDDNNSGNGFFFDNIFPKNEQHLSADLEDNLYVVQATPDGMWRLLPAELSGDGQSVTAEVTVLRQMGSAAVLCAAALPFVCEDDGDPCTDDVCDPSTGRCGIPLADGASCSDDNLCTTNEVCQAGRCVWDTLDCDDGDACTTDRCDPATGTCRAYEPGDRIDAFVTEGAGGLGSLRAVAFAQNGDLLVVDDRLHNSGGVLRYDGRTGRYIDRLVKPNNFGNVHQPTFIAIGPDGNVYLGAGGQGSGGLLRFDPSTGNELGVAAPPSMLEGEPHIRDVAFFGTFAYVLNSRGVFRFDAESWNPHGLLVPEGSHTSFNDPNKMQSQDTTMDPEQAPSGGYDLFGPTNIALDGEGYLYVLTDPTGAPHDQEVLRFEPDGTFKERFVDPGEITSYAEHIAFDPHGNLYISSHDGVRRYSGLSGDPLELVVALDGPAIKPAFSGAGGLVVVGLRHANQVWRLAPTPSCDDGDACTQADTCGVGLGCVGSPIDVAKTCDDGNPCTLDACDSFVGCITTTLANLVACDDQDACTQNDVCINGTCTAGPAVDCTDSDICTAEFCDSASGCQYPPAVNEPSCNAPADCSANRPDLAQAQRHTVLMEYLSNGPLNGQTIYTVAFAGGKIYVGADNGLYQGSVASGSNQNQQVQWTPVFLGSYSGPVQVLHKAPSKLYAANDSGNLPGNIFVLSHNGVWERTVQVSEGVVSLADAPAAAPPERIVAGGRFGELFVSIDHGQSFHSVLNSGGAHIAQLVPVEGSNTFVASTGSTVRYLESADGGATFAHGDVPGQTFWASGMSNWPSATGGTHPLLILGAFGSNMIDQVYGCDAPCRNPVPLGNSHQMEGHVGTVGVAGVWKTPVALSPGGTIFVASDRELWFSNDNGQSWRYVSNLFDCSTPVIIDIAVQNSWVYVTTTSGIFRMALNQFGT